VAQVGNLRHSGSADDFMSSPTLSVCIVNWNTRDDLEQAIAAVLAADPGLALQVVVVDNGSRDGSAAMVRDRFPGVSLLAESENMGFARGHNLASRQAAGSYLLMLNPDTLVRPGALSALVRFMASHPEAGAVGPRLLNSDGSLQFSCRQFPRPMAALFRNTPLGKLVPRNRYAREYLMGEWDHERPRQVDWVSGAAICIRREAWEQVGPFDEGFFMYAEDIDWCLRAEGAGWKIYYLPEAVIVHRIGRASDQRPLRMVVEFHRSMARFYRKHYAEGWPRPVRWLPAAGIWARAGVVLAETLWGLARNRLAGAPRGTR
jgi:hypothetical protein